MGAFAQLCERRSWPRLVAFPELAPFEQHVAMLLIDDHSLESVADQLEVSRGTVYTAKCRALLKLNVQGLAGLTRLAIRRGYIAP